jgi:lipoprotein-anchoring transpeptidase ErfK/SrfK
MVEPVTAKRHGSRSWLATFIARHGWRAFALPVLAVVSVIALALPMSEHHRGRPVAAPAASPVAHLAVRHATGPRPTASPTPPVENIQAAPDSTACLTNTAPTLVLVSISQQHVWMCQGRVQVNSTPATTGEVVNGDATPTGTWVVQGKQTDRYLDGPGYHDYVHYWIPFNGDFGFHDATWQTMPFGSPGYRTQGSHGCVHLPMTEVAWLYHWAQAGSTVVTVEA